MKSSTQQELNRTMTKIRNICKNISDIERKIESMRKEVEKLEENLVENIKHASLVGKSFPKKDQIFTEERAQKAKEHNEKLYQEKLELYPEFSQFDEILSEETERPAKVKNFVGKIQF